MLNKVVLNDFIEWYFYTYGEYPDFTERPHIDEARKQYQQQTNDQALLFYLDEYEGSC